MNLAEFAAAAEALAARAEESLALEVAQAAAKELLTAMFIVTPVLSGDLRDSERIQSVSGSGSHAVALVGPDIIYDRFRNDGGTITRKKPRPAVLGTPATGFFGRGNPATVKQQGSHYMERAEDEARPFVDAVGRMVVDEFVRL